MKSKSYKSGGAISDSERKSMKESMERTTGSSVNGALKAIKREFGGSMTDRERKELIEALNRPTKKSMGGSMKTKGYSKGGSYQGQKQRYKQTGEV